MDYQLKVKANVCLDVSDYDLNPSTFVEVNVPIPEEEWKSMIDSLTDAVWVDIGNAEDLDGIKADDFADSSGYIASDGYCYDCNATQTRMAYHLTAIGADLRTILGNHSALSALRDAMVAELETNQPERIREIEMLKNMKDLDSEEFEDDEWDGKNWETLSDTGRLKEMVTGEYPLDLLDELARRISSIESKE